MEMLSVLVRSRRPSACLVRARFPNPGRSRRCPWNCCYFRWLSSHGNLNKKGFFESKRHGMISQLEELHRYAPLPLICISLRSYNRNTNVLKTWERNFTISAIFEVIFQPTRDLCISAKTYVHDPVKSRGNAMISSGSYPPSFLSSIWYAPFDTQPQR